LGIISSFIVHFIPRLTLVSFIEIFAYFFLRLYRNAISEIRYFQNELTNGESAAEALLAVIIEGAEDKIGSIADKLASVERNGVLKKGETTIELLREERASSLDRNIIDEYKKLIETLKPFAQKT
jgi:hypothetical protein